MCLMSWPGPRPEASRACPSCGRAAPVHARRTRAIHDWERPDAPTLRLRCCGRTFTVAAPGVAPGARFSLRVVQLARVLVLCGLSRRDASVLLTRSGTPATPAAVASWTRGLRAKMAARPALAEAARGRVCVRLRRGLHLVFGAGEPARLARLLREEGARYAS